jgi:hypothetical protein
LTKLTELNLGDNAKLTGTIPAQLSTLTNLESLSYRDNVGLTAATIPSYIGTFTKLTYLNLRNCTLTGVIPPSLLALTNVATQALVGSASALVTFIFIFSALCARKSHNQFATSHTSGA